MLLTGSSTCHLFKKVPSQIPRCRFIIQRYSTETLAQAKKKLIYASPNIGLVKLVKRFSLSTLGLSALATPTVMCYWDAPAVQAANLSSTMFLGESLIRFVLTQLVLTAVAASACSTGVLTYILAPYINKIYLLENGLPQSTTAKKDENHNIEKYNITPNSIITIETMDILTRRRTSTLRLRDLVPALDSSFSTWKVNNQILKKQHELEQSKGIKPLVQQQKFWLDQRNIMGEMEIMSNILRVVNEQGQKQRLI